MGKKHTVYIVGFNDDLSQKIEGVKYITLGSSAEPLKLCWTTFFLSLQFFFKTGSFSEILKTIRQILNYRAEKLKRSNFNKAVSLINPDIVHIQWPSLLNICTDILKNPSIKIILSQRGYQSNVRPFVDSKNFNKLVNLYPQVDGFHSVSKAISQQGDKIFKKDNKIDKVVYTGLDLKKIKFRESVHKSNIVNLVSIGRPHWIKGYKYAIETIKILRDRGINISYTIVGAENNEELLFLINEYHLNSIVKLIPKVSHNKVIEYINNADALLLSSIEEGIANVVVESMAMGTPVISTDCGGMAELVINNENGWLVPNRNPKAMADAIEEFINTDSNKLKDIVLEARKKIEQQHTEIQMIKGMESLYYKVLNSNFI